MTEIFQGSNMKYCLSLVKEDSTKKFQIFQND